MYIFCPQLDVISANIIEDWEVVRGHHTSVPLSQQPIEVAH